jgi:hypothetical protein
MVVNPTVVDIENQPIYSKEVAGCDADRNKNSTSNSINPLNSDVFLEGFSNDANESNNSFKDAYIGKYPLIYDVVLYSEFKAHQRGFFDIYECIVPTIVFVVAALTQYNIYNSATNGVYFHLALSCICFNTILYSAFVCINLPGPRNFMKNSRTLCGKKVKSFQLSWVGQNTEDVLTIIGTLFGGFILYGRVFNGQCDSKSLWESQVSIDISCFLKSKLDFFFQSCLYFCISQLYSLT